MTSGFRMVKFRKCFWHEKFGSHGNISRDSFLLVVQSPLTPWSWSIPYKWWRDVIRLQRNLSENWVSSESQSRWLVRLGYQGVTVVLTTMASLCDRHLFHTICKTTISDHFLSIPRDHLRQTAAPKSSQYAAVSPPCPGTEPLRGGPQEPKPISMKETRRANFPPVLLTQGGHCVQKHHQSVTHTTEEEKFHGYSASRIKRWKQYFHFFLIPM